MAISARKQSWKDSYSFSQRRLFVIWYVFWSRNGALWAVRKWYKCKKKHPQKTLQETDKLTPGDVVSTYLVVFPAMLSPFCQSGSQMVWKKVQRDRASETCSDSFGLDWFWGCCRWQPAKIPSRSGVLRTQKLSPPPPPEPAVVPRDIKDFLALVWSRNIAFRDMFCLLPGHLAYSWLPSALILLRVFSKSSRNKDCELPGVLLWLDFDLWFD